LGDPGRRTAREDTRPFNDEERAAVVIGTLPEDMKVALSGRQASSEFKDLKFLNPNLEAMLFPLIFPCGEYGLVYFCCVKASFIS